MKMDSFNYRFSEETPTQGGFVPSVPMPAGSALKIYDSTLRDGEQMPGVAMSPTQKYQIATELSILGCHILDVGFISVSSTEQQALNLILNGKCKGTIRENIEIVVMCRATAMDIDATLRAIKEAGFSAKDVTLLIFTSASPLHIRLKLGGILLRREGINPELAPTIPFCELHEANKRMVADAIRYALSEGTRKIEFGTEDASRSPLDLLLDLVEIAVAAGATRYVFPDTTGSLTPESAAAYCDAITSRFSQVERVSHFHNDFGLATANVVTGVQHGFTTFTTTVNGIGERAGNAPLHSVVATLKYLYGLEIPNFRYDRLQHIKRLVEEVTGVPLQAHEPVVGYNAFAHESGIHTHGVGLDRRTYEAIPYKEVGGTPRFVNGKHTGLAHVRSLLAERTKQLGFKADREIALRVVEAIKRIRERRAEAADFARWIRQYYSELGRLGISDDEVIEVAMELTQQETMVAADDSKRAASEGL